jgi:hypothetical protein
LTRTHFLRQRRRAAVPQLFPAPTWNHAADAFIVAHAAAGAWADGTAVKYRQTLTAIGSRLAGPGMRRSGLWSGTHVPDPKPLPSTLRGPIQPPDDIGRSSRTLALSNGTVIWRLRARAGVPGVQIFSSRRCGWRS